MFLVIGIMFGGILVGLLLRKAAWTKRIGQAIPCTILLLLFFLGVSSGSNPEIIRNLPTLGGQAFLLAIAATFGSVLAARFVYHFFFRKGEDMP